MTEPRDLSSQKKSRQVTKSGQRLSKTGRKYTLSAVGFVDTLGAKALSDSEVFMNALAYMVDLQERISLMPHATAGVRTTYFSDNIGASVVIEDLEIPEQKKAVCKLLRLLGAIQLYYLREFAILCRGGVAMGQCFHNDNVIFGPALVEAYTLELLAETPRIVVAHGVAALCGDVIVPLHAAEPLRTHKGTLGTLLRSIDFMRAELPTKSSKSVKSTPAQVKFMARLEAAIDKGMTDPGNAGAAAKWKWTSEKFRALKSELT
jgi:hypothetical protein